MKTEFIYKPFNKFIYRTPSYPLCHLEMVLNQNHFKITPDKYTMESIYLASPVLQKELEKIDSKNKKEQQRAINAYIKYLSRMSTRCTPFGLFASCSIGAIEKDTSFFLSETYKRSTRLDMYYLCALSQSISRLPDVKEQLKYYPNNTLYEVGDNLRYIEYAYLSDKRMHSIMSVKATSTLKYILKIARSGISIKELLAYLIKQNFENNNAKVFIEDLIDSQILVGELEVSVIGKPYLNKLIDRLSKMFLSRESFFHLKTLCKINKELNNIDNRKINDVESYKNIINEINKLPATYKEECLFQVDSTNENSNIKLGESIIKEIQLVLEYLIETAPLYDNPLLKEFKRAFYERYEEQTVPLSLALDPEVGIGYPVNHGIADISPLVDKVILPSNYSISSSRKTIQSILEEHLMKKQNAKEILLHKNESKNEDVNNKQISLPPTIYVIFQILNNSENNLLLNFKGVGCGSAANLLSRFGNLNEGINTFINEITNKEKELCENKILAEIVHLPNSRVGNILSRPHLRDFEIVYLSESDYPESKKIPISDLYISINGDKLVLHSKRLNKEVCPKLTNAHNYHNDPLPIYRFLCDMQYQSTIPGIDINWGEVGKKLDFRPRIKYNNSILSLASWTIHKKEIQEFEKFEDNELVTEIEKWRNHRGIPQYAQLPNGDNELFVDFKSYISIKALLSVVKDKVTFILSEFPFDKENLVVKGNKGDYLNECIVTFYKKQT